MAVLALTACGGGPGAESPRRVARSVEAERVVEEVGRVWWEIQRADSPWLQQTTGSEIRMPDLSPAHARARAAQARVLLARVDAVDGSALSSSDRLSLEILRWDLARFVEQRELAHRLPHFAPYTFSGKGIHGVFQQLRVESAADAERYLRLAAAYPGVVRDLHDVARRQVETGWVMAAPALDPLVAMWSGFAEAPATVFAVCGEPETLPDAVPDDFCDRLEARIERRIVPALRDFAHYLDGPYREAAPAEVGLAQYPGGDEVYRALIRFYVTLDLDPEEIHRQGLEQLETNGRRMAQLRRQMGLPADAETAHRRLLEDPRIFADSADEVGERLMAHVERLRPRLAEAFDLLPNAPYGVERLHPSLEGSQTFGYYNPPTPQEPRGVYYFNGSNLEDRPLLSAGSLIYHELIPGHHFQVALQKENADLPRWRRDATFHSGFTEGWAEYASSLMAEMGLYETPLDEYGRLASENFFANRLVVDTGIHALGWTLEDARAASRRNTLMSDREIESETLRYATDLQGQALAYALGAAKIRDLRERAETELGDDFDLRAFHRAVLAHGSMPLAVLEGHVERWIEGRR